MDANTGQAARMRLEPQPEIVFKVLGIRVKCQKVEFSLA